MSNYDATTTQLFTKLSQAMGELENTRNMIWNLAPDPPGTPAVHSKTLVFDANVGKPPKATDVFDTKGIDDTTMVWLNDKVDEYIAKYFPELNACLRNLPEEWLCNVISGVKPFGIDSTIFDLVWQRARDRANAEGLSARRTLEATSSAHGFCLPTGALLSASIQMEKKRVDLVNDTNREVMLQDATIKKEILLFAEEQALRYKLGIMQAMADMFKAWMIVPNSDLERARIRGEALNTYYNALGAYWNVEIAIEELKLKAETLRVNTELQNVDMDIRAFAAARGDGGLGDAAQAFGAIAGQAANAAGSLVAQIESL